MHKFNSLLSLVALLWTAAGAHADISLTTVMSFAGTNGALPEAKLAVGKDGWLYGTTLFGGIYYTQDTYISSFGTIFKVSTNGLFTNLFCFDYYTNGADPGGGLVASPDGTLYGTTEQGSTNRAGTVFQVSPDGTLRTLVAFDWDNGSMPNTLVLGKNGLLYGTTTQGGTHGAGTVFKVSTNGTFRSLASFDGANGSGPNCTTLFQSADGSLYGTTEDGGLRYSDSDPGFGTIFKVSPAGQITRLFAFNGTNGANPNSGLVMAPDGWLYGCASTGGIDTDGTPYTGNGTLFKMSLAGRFSTVHRFTGYPLDGAQPTIMTLTRGHDNNLYGVTMQGGAFGGGMVFQLSPGGKLQPLVSFNNTNGYQPSGGLVETTPGLFYGVTMRGGAQDMGTIFQVCVQRPLNRPVVSVRRSPTRWKQSDGPITLEGRAWSKQGVQQVLVELNHDRYWMQASSTNQWTNWTASVYLSPGKNTVRAYAVDTVGVISLTDTATFSSY